MDKIIRNLISRSTINSRIRKAARAIEKDYEKDEEVVVVCTLAGAVPFYSELMNHLSDKFKPSFISVTSYVGENSNGKPKIEDSKLGDIKGKKALIIEDIIDTGESLANLYDYLTIKGAADIKSAVMLNKEARRTNHTVSPDYILFDIPDRFVIGNGLDYDGKYRNLKGVKCFTTKDDPNITRDRINIIKQSFTPVRRNKENVKKRELKQKH